jgi:hypothetical protein
MLSVITLSVVMQNVVMRSAVTLSVMESYKQLSTKCPSSYTNSYFLNTLNKMAFEASHNGRHSKDVTYSDAERGLHDVQQNDNQQNNI